MIDTGYVQIYYMTDNRLSSSYTAPPHTLLEPRIVKLTVEGALGQSPDTGGVCVRFLLTAYEIDYGAFPF